ncbi:regulator of chromosome condensation 1/beta-lactamase-inhibitor protein II [Aspergillus heterothallicus]
MSSDVSPSTSEQDASRQGQENVKQALKENQMQLAKEELQGQDQVQKQQGQDEEDDEPVRGAKRKSRARSPSCEPQAKRQRTSRSRISKRQETTCRVAKRKATETHADPSKKLKTKQTKAKGKGKDVSSKSKRISSAIVNNAPTELLDVYVCGLNTDGQLGLGHSNDNAIHPTRNPHLSKKKAGVVQVAAGGAHCVALTYDNRILTWGANYEGQLGRRTRNLEDDEYPLVQSSTPNREETTPRDVDFSTTDLPEDTVFTQVAATDSATFVLTEFGDVYGWGTFRDNKSKLKEKTKRRVNADDSDYEDDDEGNCETVIGFSHANDLCQLTPTKIEGLKHITSLAAGAQHVLARHFRGSVYAWGAGSKDQLGRKQLKRAGSTHANLTPRVCIFPGNKCRSGFYGITGIGAGGHHSFAIKKNGEVYSWGWNMYGQTGIPEEESDSSDSYLESEATVAEPTLVPELQGEETISVTGGLKHSIAVTKDNRCLSWGAIRGSALGIPDKDINTNHVHSSEDGSVDEILEVPGLVTGIDGKVTSAAAGATHSLAIAGKRRAFGWGSNDEYEIGQQHKKEIGSASVIEGGELKDARVVAAVAGVQFTILLAQ